MENTALIVSLEQAMALQFWIAEGVTRAAESLCESHVSDTEIEILETRCCSLAEFGRDGLHTCEDDSLAGILLAFRGCLSGATLFGMEPENALIWARAGGNSTDPVKTYVELGSTLLSAVVESASCALQVETEIGPGLLQEDTLAGCLVATHAPSDTVLTSSRLRVMFGPQQLDANLYMLMDQKLMSALFGALSISSH